MRRILIALCCALISGEVAALAFPGVVGFGRDATGGRGGNIYFVTNTASAGNGSWSWALSQTGPRIIIFKTGGVISSSSDIPNNTTVFCQTAPGDGVAFQGSNIQIGDNVIMRGCRLFVNAGRNGWSFQQSQDFVMDHSSIAWVGNESLSSWQNSPYNTNPMARRVTISYNVIYEGLWDPNAQDRICAGFGGTKKNWEGHAMQFTPASEITIYRNLMANARGRVPRFAGPVWKAEVINNLTFVTNNVGGTSVVADNSGVPNVTGQVLVHYISNVYKNVSRVKIQRGGADFGSGSALYTSDNINGQFDGSVPNFTLSNSPVFTSLVSSSDIVSRGQLEAEIINDVGPIPRSTYLDRAVDDYQDSRSRAQCPDDTPNLSFSAGSYSTDSDNDGIPDTWEDSNGLDKNDSSDADDFSTNGYMWIEEYANSLFGSTPGDPDPPPSPPSAVPWLMISS